MNLVKLGKKGQISIPQAVLRQLGLGPDTPLLVEATDDGAILLRQVGVYPIEIYSDERLAEFAESNKLTPEQQKRWGPVLADFPGWLDAQVAQKRSAKTPNRTPAKRPTRSPAAVARKPHAAGR